MKPKIKIRQLYYGDLRDRGISFLETLSALKPTTLNSVELANIYRKRISKIRTFIALVHEHGEAMKIVGTVSLMLEQKFINNGGICGHIEDMAVHKDYQGQGIGKLLLEHSIKYARKNKAYKIILDCEDKVIPFYMKQGFVLWQNSLRLDL